MVNVTIYSIHGSYGIGKVNEHINDQHLDFGASEKNPRAANDVTASEIFEIDTAILCYLMLSYACINLYRSCLFQLANVADSAPRH